MTSGRLWAAAAAARSIALLVVMAALLWSRVGAMEQSLWNDEAYTATFFVRGGPATILSRYIPNNHVLFSLLTCWTTRTFGESEIAYRVWGVGPAGGAVALGVVWLWRRQGALAAITFAALLTVNLLALELGREARGYGLALFAQASVVVSAKRALERPSIGYFALYSFAGALGTLTLPIFGLSLAFTSVVLLVATRARALVLSLGVCVVVIVMVYAPLLRQMLASSTQEFGSPLPWYGPVVAPLEQLLLRTMSVIFFPMVPSAVILSLLVALVAFGCRRLQRTDDAQDVWLLLVPVVGSYAVLALLGLFVEDRFQSFLMINLTMLIAMGVAECSYVLHGWMLAEWAWIGMLALVGLSGWQRFADIAHRTHELPRENFKAAAAVVRASKIGRVVTNSARPVGWFFYLPGVVRVLPANRLVEEFCDSTEGIVFIDHPFRASPVNTRCLEEAGAFRHRVLQRERDDYIDVWVRFPVKHVDRANSSTADE